ncbi:FkbM family methyltransferase [Gemmata sp. JC673]|uniref:FkbM family methyltransferase n=1 Tax=Gemmata algarum TaxID=2975278 RepID=A0ABU5F4S8_9BACT|nr:FkbM family methyltransferase [Gemmata algarum]MDY3562585.1 FkbM family methyltransferase [Gemmata algarum]
MEPISPSDPVAPPPPRRSFLFGGLLGGAAGLVGGAGGLAAAKPPGWAWSPKPVLPAEPAPAMPNEAKPSYAQFGEDIVAAGLLASVRVEKPTYLDVGAYDPVASNNTYLFYTRGARGVLVEPNVAYTDRLKSVRPGDTVLAAGIGVTDATEADYYVLTADQLNTFDKAQVEHLERTTEHRLVRVVKTPLLNINRVIADHFGGVAPDFLSVDIEGLDLAVLRTLDFGRFRPKVVCVETLVTGTLAHRPELSQLFAEKGYELRGLTFPNALFMDKRVLNKA